MSELDSTPYFARNRDETDLAYEQGWNDARGGKPGGTPLIQKETLTAAYWAGFNAFKHKENMRRK